MILVLLTVIQFRGGFTPTASVTVISDRAGLVMYPDAKVQMQGVQIGKVSSLQALPDGGAEIKLALDPSQLDSIPSNVLVNIAATTVFGAKVVQFVAPTAPATTPLRRGQILDAQHVTVEVNTVFEQLTALLSKVQPDKLNETLGAIAAAFNGRGQKLGQTLSDADDFLASTEPSLPALERDLAAAPEVFDTYADAAPDFVRIAQNATDISKTIVDKQQSLDRVLLSTIGLANTGTDVLGANRQALTDVLHLLVPTTQLTRDYNAGLWCALAGMLRLAAGPPLTEPGVELSAGFLWAGERYRYPGDMPKVAATGGPQCTGLPMLPFGATPPYVVADTGANPWKYGNPGVVLNSDGLKRLLFGDIDGPPRNSAQIGQPG